MYVWVHVKGTCARMCTCTCSHWRTLWLLSTLKKKTLNVCACMYTQANTCHGAWVESDKNIRCWSSSSTLSETESLCWCVGEVSWGPWASWDSSSSGDLNWSPWACMSNILSTQSCPWPPYMAFHHLVSYYPLTSFPTILCSNLCFELKTSLLFQKCLSPLLPWPAVSFLGMFVWLCFFLYSSVQMFPS